MVVEKIRKNSSFVGKTITDLDGVTYVQTSKGPAIGVFACAGLDGNDEPIVAWSVLAPDETECDWGYAAELARSRAEALKAGEKVTMPRLPVSSKAQLKHFKERCQAYYNPSKFSRKGQKKPGRMITVRVFD